MAISDFSSLLELAAALNIAYIAGDYSTNGYTHILSEKFFEFPEKIKKSFEKSEQILCEKESLESLKNIEIKGFNKETANSIRLDIDESIRTFEKLEQDINDAKETLNRDIQQDCESKSFSSLSLCMFLFCAVSLFLGGISAGANFTVFPKILNVTIGILLSIYIVTGWIKNTKTCLSKVDYAKLSHSFWVFLIVCIVAVIVSFVVQKHYYPSFDPIISWFNIILVIFPFLNFVAFIFIINNKGKNIAKKIKSKVETIENNCESAKDKADKLKTTYNHVTMLDSEPTVIEEGIVNPVKS